MVAYGRESRNTGYFISYVRSAQKFTVQSSSHKILEEFTFLTCIWLLHWSILFFSFWKTYLHLSGLCHVIPLIILTMEVLAFEQTYMYEILVRIITYLWMCWWVSFFCKTLQTCSRYHCRCHCRSHTQYTYINYECKWGLSIKCSKKYEWLQNTQWRKARWSHVINAHSIISLLNATSMTPAKLSTGSPIS